MASKSLLFSVISLFVASSVLHAAGTGDQEKEYQQVRTIALRDPKVKAAYAEADRKLEAKIVQIDPALANYRSHGPSEPEKKASSSNPSTPAKPSVVKGGFRAPHASPAATTGTSAAPTAQAKHTIASGDTLGAIASHYGITVAALKKANPAVDEKKLIIGEVLTIPAKKSH